MEPLHVHGDRDLRPRIETDDGEPIRVTAIRMKRGPLARSALFQRGQPEFELVEPVLEDLQFGLVGQPPLRRAAQPW